MSNKNGRGGPKSPTLEQQQAIDAIRRKIRSFVRHGSRNYLPIDTHTGELVNQPHGGGLRVVPEELLELIELLMDDRGRLPPSWCRRLVRLRRETGELLRHLPEADGYRIRQQLKATGNVRTDSFSPAGRHIIRELRRIRQQFATELLNALLEQQQEKQQEQQPQPRSSAEGQPEEGEGAGEDGDDEVEAEERQVMEMTEAGDDADAEDDAEGGEDAGDGDDNEATAWANDAAEEAGEQEGGGRQPSAGPRGANQPPKPKFNLGNGEVSSAEVRAFTAAMEHIMARQAENPTRLPRWNYGKLLKRQVTFQDPMPARQPVLQKQGVLFIIDNSPSMTAFQQAANTLAECVFRAGWADGHNNLVVVPSSNGEFHSEREVFYESLQANGAYGHWVNGRFEGPLPQEPAMFGYSKKDHARRWRWFIRDYLKKAHGVDIRLVVFFADGHGAYQWSYLSHSLPGVKLVWLDPRVLDEEGRDKSDDYRTGHKTPPPMREWTGVLMKSAGAMTEDAAFGELPRGSPEIPLKFRRFKRPPGRYFSNVDGIPDIIKAIKKVAV